MEESLEVGVSKYEVGIFHDGIIVEIFRTDSEQFQSVILAEATRRMSYLRREHPNREYKVDKVSKEITIRNAGIVHP